MSTRLTIHLTNASFELLVRLAQEMRARGHEVTPEMLAPALMKLGLRACGVEACGITIASYDVSALSREDWDRFDSAVASLLLHGVAGAS